MKVRAKFKVENVVPNDDDGGGTVSLHPVYSGSPENDAFYRLTPGGAIMLSTVSSVALSAFKVGAEFYVDFTPAE